MRYSYTIRGTVRPDGHSRHRSVSLTPSVLKWQQNNAVTQNIPSQRDHLLEQLFWLLQT